MTQASGFTFVDLGTQSIVDMNSKSLFLSQDTYFRVRPSKIQPHVIIENYTQHCHNLSVISQKKKLSSQEFGESRSQCQTKGTHLDEYVKTEHDPQHSYVNETVTDEYIQQENKPPDYATGVRGGPDYIITNTSPKSYIVTSHTSNDYVVSERGSDYVATTHGTPWTFAF